MTSSNPRGIFTVIYDPATGLLFAPDNDVLVCDVPINEIETDTEQIDYIQRNGILLKDVIYRGLAAYWALIVYDIVVASSDAVCQTLNEATGRGYVLGADPPKLIPNGRETDGSN